MQSALRSFIPPAAFSLKRRMFPAPGVASFASYAEALAHCGTGYDSRQLAEVVVQKTLRHQAGALSDMRSVSLALALRTALFGKTLNVIDFGGAAGAHYLQARAYLGDSISLRWHVVETPILAELANQRLADNGLRFFADVGAAVAALGAPVDLLLSSGTLQYMPEPLSTLKTLCAVGAPHLFLTRLALADVHLPARTIVQRSMLSKNGPGPLPEGFADAELAYPATFADRLEAEATIAQRYSIDLRFTEDRGAYTIGHEPISMYGYLATIRLEP